MFKNIWWYQIFSISFPYRLTLKTKSTMVLNINQCRICNGTAKASKGYLNQHNIRKSYLRGEVEFETKLVNCLKCESCGHSWIPEKDKTN